MKMKEYLFFAAMSVSALLPLQSGEWRDSGRGPTGCVNGAFGSAASMRSSTAGSSGERKSSGRTLPTGISTGVR